MRFNTIAILFLIFFISLLSCKNNNDIIPAESLVEIDEQLSGGNTTIFDKTSKAYTFPLANINTDLLKKHIAGDAVFEATFVSPPSFINAGLGPLFNNISCKSCHVNDGRARPPLANEPFNGLLFRISSPGQGQHGGPLPLKGFGFQVQTRGVFGVQPEMDILITYENIVEKFNDGETYILSKPIYTVQNPYITLPEGSMLSPRIANPNFGLGLLNAINEKTILSLADENDNNKDGISGKPNYCYDIISKTIKLGRFGWKASQPTIIQQAAAALNGDMGITSNLFFDEEVKDQSQDVAPHDIEINDEDIENLKIYLETLAPPARRDVNNETVLQGKKLFMTANCNACHIPKIITGLTDISQNSNQTIRPFTDLLLHDMGEGLSDGRPDFKASGKEWRTPPLWGIGLTKITNGHTNFLHDGRARNLTEAIMWHDGEAKKSKEAVKKMSKVERNALLKFLESL